MAGRSYTQLQKTPEAINYKLSIRELGRVCLLLAAGQMQEGIVLVEVAPWGKVDFTLWWQIRSSLRLQATVMTFKGKRAVVGGRFGKKQ